MSAFETFFNSSLPRLLSALSTPSDGGNGPSALDNFQQSLAGAGAAYGNSSGLQSMMLQRNYKQQLADDAMRQKQLDLATQNAAGESALRTAQIGNLNSETQARMNPPLKPKEESWEIVPGVNGPNGELVQQEKNSGQTRYVSTLPGMKPAAPKNPNAQPLADDERAQLNGLLVHRYQVLHPGQDIPSDYQLQSGATADSYQRIAQSLSGEENATAQQNQRNLQQQDYNLRRQDAQDARDAKAAEPTSREKDRADLAANVNENLNQLEDILNRRPELFGKVGGRLTQLKETLGTDDADVAALKNLSDNLGMAQQSAHNMRSAQHVEAAANSILNSYKNGPDAVRGAIKSARSSVQTFLNDAGRTTAPPSGNTAPPSNTQRPPLSSFEHN